MPPRKTLLVRSLLVLAGSFISATGISLLLIPQKLLPGGVSGVAVLISYLTGLPAGALVAALNVPLFVVAWRHVEPGFAVLSLVGMVGLSVGLMIAEPLVARHVVHDPILSAVFGGAISGAGNGLALRAYGSLAGLDIIGVLIRRRLSTSIANVMLIMNAMIVVALSAVHGLEAGLMTLVSMTVFATMLDRVLTGLNRSKAVMIITDQPTEVAAAILNELHRGATFLDGEGAWGHLPKRVIYTVTTQRQVASLKRLVARIDPTAFVTVFDTTEVIGEGFAHSPAG